MVVVVVHSHSPMTEVIFSWYDSIKHIGPFYHGMFIVDCCFLLCCQYGYIIG